MKTLILHGGICCGITTVSASAERITARVSGQFVDICAGPARSGGNDCSALSGLFVAASQVCAANQKGNKASDFAVAG
jgi:hypothetical protein